MLRNSGITAVKMAHFSERMFLHPNAETNTLNSCKHPLTYSFYAT